jgi:hypothetical protein
MIISNLQTTTERLNRQVFLAFNSPVRISVLKVDFQQTADRRKIRALESIAAVCGRLSAVKPGKGSSQKR